MVLEFWDILLQLPSNFDFWKVILSEKKKKKKKTYSAAVYILTMLCLRSWGELHHTTLESERKMIKIH